MTTNMPRNASRAKQGGVTSTTLSLNVNQRHGSCKVFHFVISTHNTEVDTLQERNLSKKALTFSDASKLRIYALFHFFFRKFIFVYISVL